MKRNMNRLLCLVALTGMLLIIPQSAAAEVNPSVSGILKSKENKTQVTSSALELLNRADTLYGKKEHEGPLTLIYTMLKALQEDIREARVALLENLILAPNGNTL